MSLVDVLRAVRYLKQQVQTLILPKTQPASGRFLETQRTEKAATMGVDPQQGARSAIPTAASHAIATASSTSSAGVPTIQARGRKRKLNHPVSDHKTEDDDDDELDGEQLLVKAKKHKAKKEVDDEKRLRRYGNISTRPSFDVF